MSFLPPESESRSYMIDAAKNNGLNITFDKMPEDLDFYTDSMPIEILPTHSFVSSKHSGSGVPELIFETANDAQKALEMLNDKKPK